MTIIPPPYRDLDALLDAVDNGIQLANAFRSYQAALNDDAYWQSEEAREVNKQQVGEAFDQLVKLANQILGDR